MKFKATYLNGATVEAPHVVALVVDIVLMQEESLWCIPHQINIGVFMKYETPILMLSEAQFFPRLLFLMPVIISVSFLWLFKKVSYAKSQ